MPETTYLPHTLMRHTHPWTHKYIPLHIQWSTYVPAYTHRHLHLWLSFESYSNTQTDPFQFQCRLFLFRRSSRLHLQYQLDGMIEAALNTAAAFLPPSKKTDIFRKPWSYFHIFGHHSNFFISSAKPSIVICCDLRMLPDSGKTTNSGQIIIDYKGVYARCNNCPLHSKRWGHNHIAAITC